MLCDFYFYLFIYLFFGGTKCLFLKNAKVV